MVCIALLSLSVFVVATIDTTVKCIHMFLLTV
jgi:hypothetical protein